MFDAILTIFGGRPSFNKIHRDRINYAEMNE